MNLETNIHTLLIREKAIAEIEGYLKQKKAEATQLRTHILQKLQEEGIKTLDHPEAQVQVRTRKDRFVKEDDVYKILDSRDEWPEGISEALWPRIFDTKVALGFAEANGPEFIHTQEKKSLVVNPKKEK